MHDGLSSHRIDFQLRPVLAQSSLEIRSETCVSIREPTSIVDDLGHPRGTYICKAVQVVGDISWSGFLVGKVPWKHSGVGMSGGLVST